MSQGHLEGDGVGHAIGHAELAQAEGGAQVGGVQPGAQHHSLIGVQVPVAHSIANQSRVSQFAPARPSAWQPDVAADAC